MILSYKMMLIRILGQFIIGYILCTNIAVSQIHFSEVASPSGLSSNLNNTGASFVDINGDSLPDIYTTYATGEPSNVSGAQYYKNNGDGTFSIVNSATPLPPGDVIYTGVIADYDNDNDMDIFVSGNQIFYMFRNDGVLGFTNVSSSAGFSNLSGNVFGASWLDYNLDGYVDLFLATAGNASHILLKNNTNGTFSDVTIDMKINLAASTNVRGLAVADYDRDGDPDIFVANYNQSNHFFRNDRTQFTEIASQMGVQFPGITNAHSQFADFDNDGDFDLYIGRGEGVAPPNLMRNENNGQSFTNVTASAGFPIVSSNGSTFSDLDNDGDLDLVGVYVNSSFFGIMRNNNDGTFTDVTSGSGLLSTNSQTAVSAADYDRDGRMDLFAATLYDAKDELYHNTTTNTNNWIGFKLSGVYSNTAAIGSILDLYAGGNRMTRYVDGGFSMMGQNDLTQHFGLGSETTVDSVVIHWPSGRRTEVIPSSLNQYFSISEDTSVSISVPQAVTVTSASKIEVNLEWTSTDPNSSFRIYRSQSSGSNYTPVGTVLPGHYSFRDTTVAPNTTYYYKITSYFGFAESSKSSEVIASTAISVPQSLTVSSVLLGEVNLEWTSNDLDDRFLIYRSLISGSGYTVVDTVEPGNFSYRDTNVAHNTKYYYKIAAYFRLTESSKSSEVIATTPVLISPSNLTIDVLSSSQIKLMWSKTDQSVFTRIYRSTSTGGNFAQIDSVNDPLQEYLDQSLNDNTTYYYRVAAAWRGFRSSNSNEASGLTFSLPPVIHSCTITGTSPYKENTNIAFVCSLSGSLPKVIIEFGRPYETIGEEIVMTRGSDSLYRGTIPSTNVTKDGLWYRIRAENLADTIYYPINKQLVNLPISVPSYNSSASESRYMNGIPSNNYYLFSLPLDKNINFSNVFGEQKTNSSGEPTNWAVFQYNPDSDESPFTSVLSTTGEKGYIVYHKTGAGVTINLDSGRTPDINSYKNTILYPGWNIIRWPFTFIQTPVIKDNAKIGSVWERIKSGWSNATELKPFGGYAIRNKTATTVKLGDVLGWSAPSKSSSKEEQVFETIISAITKNGMKSSIYVGATNQDPSLFDDIQPFSIGNEIRFTLDKNQCARYFSADVHVHTWDAVINSTEEHEKITINWEMRSNEGEYVSYLIDTDNNVRIAMHEQTEYVFSARRQHHFKIIAGTSASVKNALMDLDKNLPTVFALRQNYPNPFNPTTTIDFEIAQSGNIELAIYNLLGQRVKVLNSGFYRTGFYKTVWDGTSDKGIRVASGVYLYRLQTPATTITKKLLLIK